MNFPSACRLRWIRLALGAALFLAFTCAYPTRADETNDVFLSDAEAAELRATIELLRADVRAEKRKIVAATIDFTGAEAAAFWPLHNEYTLALNRLLDERLYLINDYLLIHETMTDSEARAFAKRVLRWEKRRLQLKRKWFKKFSRAVSPRRAAQFFQLESQLNGVIDLQISAALPLIR